MTGVQTCALPIFDSAIQSLTSIIEPVMMIGVGLMVGVIIISMYLPMFKMLTLVK